MIDPSLRVLCSCLPLWQAVPGRRFLGRNSGAPIFDSETNHHVQPGLFSMFNLVRAAPISMWGRTQAEGRAMAWSGNRKQRIKSTSSCIGSHSFERTCAAGCAFFFCPSLDCPTWLSRRAIDAWDFSNPVRQWVSRRFVPSPTSADAAASRRARR